MSAWLIAPVALAALVGPATPRLLCALPPPKDATPDVYRRFGTAAFAWTAAALVAAAGLIVVWLVPERSPAWLGLATAGVLSAMLDARTGYLPRRLAQAAWALTALGALIVALLAGPSAVIGAALGALAATALFWPLWRFGRGFGFGDVRLAPVVGAACGAVDATTVFAGLLAGSLLGVVFGQVWRLSGRGRSFPYGPALVAGPFLALLVLAAAGRS